MIPSRLQTVVFAPTDDPIPAYRDFALWADSFLLGEPSERGRSFTYYHEDESAQTTF